MKPGDTFHPNRTVDSDLAANESWLMETFKDSQDVRIQKFTFSRAGGEISVLLVYCDGLGDKKQINQVIIPSLRQFFKEHSDRQLDEQLLLNHWQLSSLGREEVLDKIITHVFGGQLILFFDGLAAAYLIDIANPPQRQPEEPNTEISIRGPRDGFTEELATNVALIRKRLRTQSLVYEQFILGTRSQTKTGLLYLKDVIRPEVVEEARRRLSKVSIDGVYSTNELEELLGERTFTIFPLFEDTGRPDYAMAAMLRGRFVLLVEGAPTALIAPANLTFLVKTPEDLHNSYAFVAFQRFLRTLGFLISLFLPGFYVAVATYHQDQFPLTLLGTLVMARKGTPLPTPVEAIVMMVLFELFREAGQRLPTAVGQTLAVVGGLIIGDAAIRAGLTSPSLLVVTATTAVATFTLINQSLTGAVTILRLGIMFASSFLGIYGFLLSTFALLIFLANHHSFGVPYLSPVTPFHFRDFLHAMLRVPATFMKKRPEITQTVDSTRQGEKG